VKHETIEEREARLMAEAKKRDQDRQAAYEAKLIVDRVQKRLEAKAEAKWG